MNFENIDRRAFIAKLGGAAAVAGMTASTLADALEDELVQELDAEDVEITAGNKPTEKKRANMRQGAGSIFDADRYPEIEPLPEKPTLLDFFERRFSNGVVQHCLRSAHHALISGQDEVHIMAALVHDTIMTLMKADHGYWGADLLAPYVDERVSWGIRYHQAARFYPDEEVGYEYPDLYKQMFGENFIPERYIQDDYKYLRKHKWYMHARMITVNDTYGFDKSINPSLDDFVDIIGRNFKQPKQGLGFDNSPSAHMWRSMINPDRPL